MKSKNPSRELHDDHDSSRGKKKPKLTPIKKQKSKRTQFFDEIEELEDFDLSYKKEDSLENYFDDPDDYDDEDDEDDLN